MDPQLKDKAGFCERILNSTAKHALQRGDPDSLRSIVREVHPGIFVADLVKHSWCEALLRELDEFDAQCRSDGKPPKPPNSMHEYGIVLRNAGLDAPMQWLATSVLSPLARELFPELCPDGLVAQHAFLADYGEGRDTELALHVDQSEVTFDLCLSSGFNGGDMLFEGRRCFQHLDDPAKSDELYQHAHSFGQAVIHAGKNRHQVLPVRAGRRSQLILWGRVTDEPELPDMSTCPAWCDTESLSPRNHNR